MDNVKMNLTVTLPGSVMVSEQECSKNSTYNYTNIKFGKQSLSVPVRPSKPATQSINMTEEAYQGFISTPPSTCHTLSKWKKLSDTKRIEWHLRDIAETLGGKILSYQIFE